MRCRRKVPYVYILNSPTGTRYTGVTNDIWRRVSEHKSRDCENFTKRYGVDRLAYYEEHQSIFDALEREKQIKSWRRSKKMNLIRSLNPSWEDLAADWYDD